MTMEKAQKEYKVLKIDEMVRPGVVSGIEKYYRHTIMTKGGVVLTVDINEQDFTPKKAAPILLRKAQEADGILAL